MPRTAVLFYKRLNNLGGAEVLMSEHYKYLKRNSYSPRVICFESKALHRVDIDPSDLLAVDGSNVVSTVWRLARVLSAIKPVQVFCHSGYIELGIAALLAGLEFSVFVHQPTTMSYNETDKYSFRFIGKYRRFAKKDRMYVELMQTHASLAWRQTLYYNARAVISQYVLRRASKLFVLSNYAVREKQQVFGLTASRYAECERNLVGN